MCYVTRKKRTPKKIKIKIYIESENKNNYVRRKKKILEYFLLGMKERDTDC